MIKISFAVLVLIFSTKFVVETVDSNRNLYYHQVFENNMYKVNEPEIKKYTKKPLRLCLMQLVLSTTFSTKQRTQ